jgi:hypothetical protein
MLKVGATGNGWMVGGNEGRREGREEDITEN